MRLLITGAGGQLGRCLLNHLAQQSELDYRAFTSAELDISDAEQVAARVAEVQPDVIINAAAYTAVDKAESEPELADAVNHLGAKNLAQVAAKTGAALIHVSTDYVFDGRGKRAYLETDSTAPIGVYGRTKLAGEQAVAAACPQHLIVRTAWVYSEYGNNFVKTMLRLAQTRDELRVVEDQQGCPTYAGDLAAAILQICRQNLTAADYGIYHYVGANQCHWADFARQIFALAKQQGLIERTIGVEGIPSSEFPTTAERPAYSVLDCGKIHRQFGIEPKALEASLAQVLQRLKEAEQEHSR